MSLVVDISDSNFEELVITASASTPVVVGMYQGYSIPSRKFKPALLNFFLRNDHVPTYVIDITSNESTGSTYSVSSEDDPVTFVFNNGEVTWQSSGQVTVEDIESHLGLELPEPVIEE